MNHPQKEVTKIIVPPQIEGAAELLSCKVLGSTPTQSIFITLVNYGTILSLV
jgi:hypothetical protein